MTTTPDSTTVNELAAEVANLALRDAVHVDQWIGAVVNDRFGNECSQVRAPLHAAVARRMAGVEPAWPDEQAQARAARRPAAELMFGPGELDELCETMDERPQDKRDDPFAMVAEDCPVGPARAIAEHWFSHAALISDSVGGSEWHAIADMTRRTLDAMDAEGPQQDSGACEGCGCCTRAGCHRFADATCPTNSLGDSVCPCTED